MNRIEELQAKLSSLRLVEAAEQLPTLLEKANQNDETIARFLMNLLTYEQIRREEKKNRKTLEMGYVLLRKNARIIPSSVNQHLVTAKLK